MDGPLGCGWAGGNNNRRTGSGMVLYTKEMCGDFLMLESILSR